MRSGDDGACDEVDEKGDREQDKPARDQCRASSCVCFAEAERDIGGDGVSARFEDVKADHIVCLENQRYCDGFAERPTKTQNGGANNAGTARWQDSEPDHFKTS